MKKTKKKIPSFHLFFVPEGSKDMKQLRVTPKLLNALMLIAVSTIFVLGVQIVGFWHYRSLYQSVKSDHQKIIDYEAERKDLLTKMQFLEKNIAETEKMTGKLADLVGTEKNMLKKGIGPINPKAFNITEQTAEVSVDTLNPTVDLLDERTLSIQDRIRDLVKAQENKVALLSSTPSIWPVKGWVTSDFGYRRSPFTSAPDFHAGLDIAAQWGTPIKAAAAGVVTLSGYKGGYGKAVIIDHGFGVTTVYGHASQLLVHEGQKVLRGMEVALVGSTGHATGPHLHYEVHVDGVAVDPMKYLIK